MDPDEQCYGVLASCANCLQRGTCARVTCVAPQRSRRDRDLLVS